MAPLALFMILDFSILAVAAFGAYLYAAGNKYAIPYFLVFDVVWMFYGFHIGNTLIVLSHVVLAVGTLLGLYVKTNKE